MNDEKRQAFQEELKVLLAKYQVGLRPEMQPTISIIDLSQNNEPLSPIQSSEGGSGGSEGGV